MGNELDNSNADDWEASCHGLAESIRQLKSKQEKS